MGRRYRSRSPKPPYTKQDKQNSTGNKCGFVFYHVNKQKKQGSKKRKRKKEENKCEAKTKIFEPGPARSRPHSNQDTKIIHKHGTPLRALAPLPRRPAPAPPTPKPSRCAWDKSYPPPLHPPLHLPLPPPPAPPPPPSPPPPSSTPAQQQPRRPPRLHHLPC